MKKLTNGMDELYRFKILDWADSMGIGEPQIKIVADEDGEGFTVDFKGVFSFTTEELDIEFEPLFEGTGFTYEIRKYKGKKYYNRFTLIVRKEK